MARFSHPCHDYPPGRVVDQFAGSGKFVVEARTQRIDGARVDIGGDRFLSADACQDLETKIIARLDRFQQENPLKYGLDLGVLAGELQADATADVVRYAVKRLVADGAIDLIDDFLRLPGFDPLAGLNERQRMLTMRIEQAFLDGRFEPPSAESVVGSDKASRDLLRLLLETGRLVRLKTYEKKSLIVLHAKAVDAARTAIADKYPYPEPFALKDIRDLLQSTRKYVVPLMEHLDATGFTIRSGDQRRLKQQVSRG